MENYKDKIIDYITSQMSDEEEQAFELLMSKDEDLRIEVRLEQLRFNNMVDRIKNHSYEKGIPGPDTPKATFGALLLNWKALIGILAIIILVIVGYLLYPKPPIDNSVNMANINTAANNEVIITPDIATSDTNKVGNATGDIHDIHPTHKEKIKQSVKMQNPDSLYARLLNYYSKKNEVIFPQQHKMAGAANNSKVVDTINMRAAAINAYLIGDSAFIHKFYRDSSGIGLALKLEGLILYKYKEYDKAAEVFKVLKMRIGYEELGYWQELLCYLAKYNSRKKEFHNLASEMQKKGYYKNDIENLLNSIKLKK